MKRFIATLLIVISSLLTMHTLQAQELNCEVRVNSNKVEGSDKSIYQNLQTSLYEFINNTKFTEINFRQAEKIECSMLVDVLSREGDFFTAEISLALRRPVYKSNYSTPMFNYIDKKFFFEYTDGQTLDFNPNTYISNITSTIGFYVYLFLGLDFDSFSPNGGDPFFAVAETIANAAPQEPGSDNGWGTSGRKNRYAIISDINNRTYAPLRQFLYDYHRLGLDVMAEDPAQGRESILSTLSNLRSIYERNSMCYFLQLIVETKRDEIIQIFSQGDMKIRNEAANIMKTIDPSQSSRYDAMLQNNGN
ncbi:MAG: DUF4835 family protein [bacterium]|nr:MAG: hypothetical protein F082_474 [bacterium F082]KWW31093.1 MAG: hypothetical protein AUK64_407 [bacterium P201]MDO5316087.1 DUF4835 family protein [bacterium]